jgi:uncharacterized protein YdeI (BOF family)
MSIKQYMTKIKGGEARCVDTQSPPQNNDLFLILLIIFVALASFGLGRLSAISRTPHEGSIVFEPQMQQSTVYTATTPDLTNQPNTAETGTLVASKSGTKYHFPWCSGAIRIKEENKIWFNTIEEARAAGYTPAANCKGLE